VDAAYIGSAVALGEFSIGEVSVHNPNEDYSSGFELGQNFPNPFSRSTTIRYQVSEEGPVSLSVYNLTGKEVARLVDEQKQAGNYEVILNAEELADGVYYYRLQAGTLSQSKKMTIIKN